MLHGGGHLVAEYELLISLVSELSNQKKEKEKQRKRREREKEKLSHSREGEGEQGWRRRHLLRFVQPTKVVQP